MVIVITKHVNVFLDKPTAVPTAKKAAVDGKLFFVSEPQSIRVVESKYFLKNTSSLNLNILLLI